MTTATAGLELWDVCAGRHGGNAESADAARRAMACQREEHGRIRRIAFDAGPYGTTLPEIAERMGKQKNAVSPRITELKAIGDLAVLRDAEGKTVRRNGCAVLLHPAHAGKGAA